MMFRQLYGAAVSICALTATSSLALSAGHQVPFAGPGRLAAGEDQAHGSDIGNASMTALLHQYAPVFKLSIQERFFPSSIEYMLPHFEAYEDDKRTPHPIKPPLTPSTVGDLPRSPSTYLNILEPHNPQPFLDSGAEYLVGPAGLTGGRDDPGPDGRGRIKEVVYGFWVDQPHGVVDLWYWTYYPFNFGKPVGPFGFLGHHVSDWERLRVRSVNGTAVSVDYNTHTGGRFSAGTFRWADVPKVDGRPVAFVAAGSHGVWPTPGDHVYADVLDVFKLVDVTDDYGPLWDTKCHVVPLQYRDLSEKTPMRHNGTESWLDYPGHWGNRGVNNCWWHRAVGYCQLIDAPPGPNRQLLAPPQCILAPLRSNTSSFYSFYLDPSTVREAVKAGIGTVKVEQICARPKKRNDGDEGGDDDGDPADNGGGDMKNDPANGSRSHSSLTLYNEDGRKEEDFAIWSTSGSVAFQRESIHEVEVPSCKGRRSAVKAYKLHLCLSNGKCPVKSAERKLCTYNVEEHGFRSGGAAVIRDVDDWTIPL